MEIKLRGEVGDFVTYRPNPENANIEKSKIKYVDVHMYGEGKYNITYGLKNGDVITLEQIVSVNCPVVRNK